MAAPILSSPPPARALAVVVVAQTVPSILPSSVVDPTPTSIYLTSILYQVLVESAEESDPTCVAVISSHNSRLPLEFMRTLQPGVRAASSYRIMVSRASVGVAIYR